MYDFDDVPPRDMYILHFVCTFHTVVQLKKCQMGDYLLDIVISLLSSFYEEKCKHMHTCT